MKEEHTNKKNIQVPIWKKLNLTIEEAAAYSGIGIVTLRERIASKEYDFILNVGTKKLIKRKQFEKYLDRINAV